MVVERSRSLGKIYGSFFVGRPMLIVADAEVIRQITIKDFDSFQDHQVSEWSNKYQRNFLVWLKGEHWRRVRALMTPTFTSGKIRRMFKLLGGCAHDLVENFQEQIDRKTAMDENRSATAIDLYETFGMYTMDGITTCCYGIKLKREQTIEEASSRNAFVRDANLLFKFNLLRFILISLTPKFITKRFEITMLPESRLQGLINRVEKLIEKRRQGVGNKYDDLLQSLVDARLDDEMELDEMDQKENHHAGLTHESLLNDQERLKTALIKDHSNQQQYQQTNDINSETQKPSWKNVHMDDLEILSEAMFLLAAGLDTTRSSLSTITYFLAHNPNVQDRLYEELMKIVKFDEHTGKAQFDYDSLTSCDYLDAVISESLRFFSPVPMIDRLATEDYRIEKYNIDIPKNSRILLGFHAVHNDPDYWQAPDEFNPDRFMPGQREQIVPGSYVPFGLGPRHCIGMRFSLTETKLGLATVLVNFKFAPAPGTDYPPKPNFGMGLVHVKNGRVLVSRRIRQQ